MASNVSGWQDWQQRVSPFGQNDLLFSNSDTPNGSPQTFNVALNALYQALLVVILSPNQNDMQVLIDNDGFIGVGFQQTQIIGGADTPGQFLFPMLNFLGDTVAVTIVFTTTMLHGEIAIYGVRQLTNLALRTDGRPYPQNGLINGIAAAGGGQVDLAPAPLAPTRVLIGGVALGAYAAAAGGYGQIVATVNGTDAVLLAVPTGASVAVSQSWETGVLCDPGTKVYANVPAGAGSILATIQYDLVT
ncbi:MAG: hypothetical protein ACRDUW_05010 [Pseudonocardiaceae bacterium]